MYPDQIEDPIYQPSKFLFLLPEDSNWEKLFPQRKSSRGQMNLRLKFEVDTQISRLKSRDPSPYLNTNQLWLKNGKSSRPQ